jgi:hypothetical protein
MAEPLENGHHQEARYVVFKSLPDGSLNEDGQPALNRYSSTLTREYDYPGAQVCISKSSASCIRDN